MEKLQACKCKQCGAEFELVPEEVEWYKSQFGEGCLPKRCPNCRKENKQEAKKKKYTLQKQLDELNERVNRLEGILKEAVRNGD